MTPVVIADADGRPATRALSRRLALHLRRVGVPVDEYRGTVTGADRITCLSGVVRCALGDEVERLALVLLGDEAAQRRLVWRVALAGLLPKVRLVVHAGAARLPYAPSMADLFARADVVVTESELGAQAVQQCCEEGGAPARNVVVLPPLLPWGAGLSAPSAADRRAQRQARMGVDDDAVVVGCWTGHGPEEVASLGLRIFQLFAQGHYWRCGQCDHLTPWAEDDQRRPAATNHCARCGSVRGVAGRARDRTRLVLIGDPRSEDGLWRTGTIGTHLGLGDRIVQEPMPTSPRDLLQLWGCIDVHVQPHVLADVPPSLRVSCALGVPIVATGYGAVEEWLAGAASLVPPRMVLDHSAGHRIALMDAGGAVSQLCHLAEDPAARRLASARLRELARGWEASAVLDPWIDLLDVRFAS